MFSGAFELSCCRSSRNGKNRWVMPPLASSTTRRSLCAIASPISLPNSRKSSVVQHWLSATLIHRVAGSPRNVQTLTVP